MKSNQTKNPFYLKYILIFFLVSIISLLLIDKFLIVEDNKEKLKKERREYLINLAQDKPIIIGVTWPSNEESGEDYFKKGVVLALEELNKEKILGRSIEMIYRDDKWEVETAKKIAHEFSKNKNIVAVIAHDDIDLAIPASITYQYSGLIMISPAVSTPNLTRESFSYIFRNTPSDIVIGKNIAQFFKFMNFKRIIVLSATDTYSEGLSAVFIEEAKSNKLDIIYSNKFRKNNFNQILTDISPNINHSIDYDAIFIAGDEELVVSFVNKAHQYGIYAPFVGGDILDSPQILKTKKDMTGLYIASIYNGDILNEKMQYFIEGFQKKYHHTPDTWAAQGYDAIMLLAEAIKRAESIDPLLIRNQLQYMSNFYSIFGKYWLDTHGNSINRKIYFKKIEKGKFKYSNFKTKDLS